MLLPVMLADHWLVSIASFRFTDQKKDEVTVDSKTLAGTRIRKIAIFSRLIKLFSLTISTAILDGSFGPVLFPDTGL